MSESNIKNAKITSTVLGIEDHGLMTFWLNLKWLGGGVGFGGYCLDEDAPNKDRQGDGHSYQAIRKILETIGVDRWEKLPNQLIRIESNGLGRGVTKIGHIMEDRWFDIASYMKETK